VSPDARAETRMPHLDNLRTILVAWVIGGHALLGYSAVGGWAYDEFHEVTFAPPTELVLVAIIGPSGLFVIGLFFFHRGPVDRPLGGRHVVMAVAAVTACSFVVRLRFFASPGPVCSAVLAGALTSDDPRSAPGCATDRSPVHEGRWSPGRLGTRATSIAADPRSEHA